MTTLQFIIGALPSAIIPVGIREENDVSAVEVDFSAWAEEFGAGAMQLLVKRSGDTSAYPVVLTQTGTAATWTLSSTDLAKTGELLAEYVYTVSGQVKKSCVLRFYVVPDIGTPGSAPDPYQSWLAQLTALAAQTETDAATAAAASEAIQNMSVEAETLEPDAAATVTKTVDPVTGAVTLTFGIPRGQDGSGGGGSVSPYTSNPAALGTASPGSSANYSRGDHVHPKPTPADIGALPAAGGTMGGAIAMDSNKITGLADGTADGDAVNLGQVSGLISTNTAYFRGSFASKAALLAVAWQTTNPAGAYYVTNNDFAIVQDDESQSDECWRYVYVSGSGWAAQYRINETPLTTAQLAALNSGATASNIGAIADKIDKPSSPASGAFLVWNGSAWVAQTLSTWQASSY